MRVSPNTVDLSFERIGSAFAAKDYPRASYPLVEGTRVQAVVFAVSGARPAAGSPGQYLLQPGWAAAAPRGGLGRPLLRPPLRQDSRSQGSALWRADRSNDANVLLGAEHRTG